MLYIHIWSFKLLCLLRYLRCEYVKCKLIFTWLYLCFIILFFLWRFSLVSLKFINLPIHFFLFLQETTSYSLSKQFVVVTSATLLSSKEKKRERKMKKKPQCYKFPRAKRTHNDRKPIIGPLTDHIAFSRNYTPEKRSSFILPRKRKRDSKVQEGLRQLAALYDIVLSRTICHTFDYIYYTPFFFFVIWCEENQDIFFHLEKVRELYIERKKKSFFPI